MSAQSENVLSVQSRNVLLTGSVWRGGFRNTPHDATGPRPAGRTQESQEGTDHATSGCCRDWPERAECSTAAGEVETGRRSRCHAPTAKPAVEPPSGTGDQTSGSGNSQPGSLQRFWADPGERISPPRTRHRCEPRNGESLDDRGQAMAR